MTIEKLYQFNEEKLKMILEEVYDRGWRDRGGDEVGDSHHDLEMRDKYINRFIKLVR